MNAVLVLLLTVWLGVGLAQTAQSPPATSPGSSAADSALEARTSAVAAQLRCPVCQGLSIQDSPTDLAQQMRALVREQLAAGRSPEEVKAYFVGRYGEWILLEPKAEGFNLAVYLAPLALLLAGSAVVATAVRRWTRRSAPVAGSGQAAELETTESVPGER